MSLLRAGLWCGIVCPIVWLAVLGTAMLARPEFSPVTDYISELGESGSATELFVRYAGFQFTGLLYIVFAGAAATLLLNDGRTSRHSPPARTAGAAGAGAAPGQPRRTNARLAIIAASLVALDGVGRIGAGVYPCDLGCDGVSATQALHRLFATIGFCSGVVAALAWGVVARRYTWLCGFATVSTGAGLLTTALLLLMTWGANPFPLTGLYEHLATVAISIWTLALAVRLVRRSAELGQTSLRTSEV